MSVVITGGESDLAPSIVEYFAKSDTVCHCLSKEECDVRDVPSIERAMSLYKPDIVINLAGVSHLQVVRDSNAEQWYDEIQTNLIGSYNVARATVARNCMMIFIGSVAGLYGKPTHSGYSASKAGVHSLVQSLGMEGHKAYGIAPGRVNTKMREKDFPGEDPATRLKPEQIAEIVGDIMNGKYNPGDIVVIRMKGTETTIRRHHGFPWRYSMEVKPL